MEEKGEGLMRGRAGASVIEGPKSANSSIEGNHYSPLQKWEGEASELSHHKIQPSENIDTRLENRRTTSNAILVLSACAMLSSCKAREQKLTNNQNNHDTQ